MENHLVKMIDDNIVDYDDLSRIQEEVADKIIKNRYDNFILKFETQLGKTRTATMALKRYVSPLIVCPAKLSKQWIDELETQGVSSYEVITINKLNMKDNVQKYNWGLHDIIIITNHLITPNSKKPFTITFTQSFLTSHSTIKP